MLLLLLTVSQLAAYSLVRSFVRLPHFTYMCQHAFRRTHTHFLIHSLVSYSIFMLVVCVTGPLLQIKYTCCTHSIICSLMLCGMRADCRGKHVWVLGMCFVYKYRSPCVRTTHTNVDMSAVHIVHLIYVASHWINYAAAAVSIFIYYFPFESRTRLL